MNKIFSKSKIIIASLITMFLGFGALLVGNTFGSWVFNTSDNANANADVAVGDFDFGIKFSDPGFYDKDGNQTCGTDVKGNPIYWYDTDWAGKPSYNNGELVPIFKTSCADLSDSTSPVTITGVKVDWDAEDYKSFVFPTYYVVKVTGKLITHTITTLGSGSKICDSYSPSCTTFTIPSTVTKISNYAFYNQGVAMTVLGGENVTYYGNGCFCGDKMTSFPFSSKTEYIGSNAFYDNAFASDIDLSATPLKTLGGRCFAEMKNPSTVSIDLPSSLASIGIGIAVTSKNNIIINIDKTEAEINAMITAGTCSQRWIKDWTYNHVTVNYKAA